ncbi:MAG TPA: hypothetical protein VLM38_01310 [Blastocatellia bacterium]|nr:hypothetical protein [Blastocatellia bacterium]
MKTMILRILVLALYAAVSAEYVLGQQIDPKVVTRFVAAGNFVDAQ